MFFDKFMFCFILVSIILIVLINVSIMCFPTSSKPPLETPSTNIVVSNSTSDGVKITTICNIITETIDKHEAVVLEALNEQNEFLETIRIDFEKILDTLNDPNFAY